MDEGSTSCEHCKERLIEIDHYGEQLTECFGCNVWHSNKHLDVEDVKRFGD